VKYAPGWLIVGLVVVVTILAWVQFHG